MFKGINVVWLPVPDLDRARAFYQDKLGLGEPVYDLPEVGWVEFATGGAGGNLALNLVEPQAVATDVTTVVLNVEDCFDACLRLRALGVECEDPEVFPGYVTLCTFRDPFGNRLQMCSPPA